MDSDLTEFEKYYGMANALTSQQAKCLLKRILNANATFDETTLFLIYAEIKNVSKSMVNQYMEVYKAIVAQQPEHLIHRLLLRPQTICCTTEFHYRILRDEWYKQVRSHRGNVAVLDNAARFFVLPKPRIAAYLWTKAILLMPDNLDLRSSLSFVFTILAIRGTPDNKNRYTRLATDMFKFVLAKDPNYYSNSGSRIVKLERLLRLLSQNECFIEDYEFLSKFLVNL